MTLATEADKSTVRVRKNGELVFKAMSTKVVNKIIYLRIKKWCKA